MTWNVDRRAFLQAAAVGAAHVLVHGSARAVDLNGKLRVASIGTGNKGRDDLQQISASPRVEVVAICNVDRTEPHLGWAALQFKQAAQSADYRRIFDHPDTFDAVIVSTPDHMHAPIALAAMQLGKHVFCQKPLTHTVREAREMRLSAERNRVVTQMGNQIQSHHIYRRAVALVRDGAIGKVKEVHSWQSGPLVWMLAKERPAKGDPVPETLDWNLWLGVAPERPYARAIYHPFNWRAWQDFSGGQLGDFGCHILDPVFKALDLNAPLSVQAEAEPLNNEVWATKCKIAYQFPGNQRTAADTLPVTWYDGLQHQPSREALGLPAKFELPTAGSVLIGENGTLVIPHMGEPQLLPEEKFRDFAIPQLEDVNHYTSWVDACLGDGATTSSFAYAGPLTETVLLGTVAVRFPGETLQWDAPALSFTNHTDATARINKEYRPGWSMEKLIA